MVYLKNSKIAVRGAEQIAGIFRDLLALEDPVDRAKEHFYCMHLDSKSRIKLVELVSLGSLNSSVVHPRETYRRAVIQGSASIIVGHNHPSGEPEPSDEDTRTTKLLFEAGNVLGIQLLDHIVFTDTRYFSFRSNSTHTFCNMKKKGGENTHE